MHGQNNIKFLRNLVRRTDLQNGEGNIKITAWVIEKIGSQDSRWLKTAVDHYIVCTLVNRVVQRGISTCLITMHSLIRIYSAESGGRNMCLTDHTTIICNVVLGRVVVEACAVRKVIQTAHLSDIFQELEVIKEL